MTPLALSAETIVNGETYTWTFNEAVLQIESDNEGRNYCGTRQYKVYRSVADGSAEVTDDWITITGPTTTGEYEMVASPIDDTLVTGTTLALVFEITLPDQPNNPGYTETLDITVRAATCDCSLLLWDNPVSASEISVGLEQVTTNTVTIQEATVNEDSKTTTPAIRRCYLDSPCDETYTTTLVDADTGVLPDFMDYTGTTLTITPTIASHINVWNLQLTQTVASGTNPEFVTAIVTVTCTIVSIADPTPPSTYTYYVYDPTMTVDLTATVYTQSPPCEYPAVNSFTWVIPSDGLNSIT